MPHDAVHASLRDYIIPKLKLKTTKFVEGPRCPCAKRILKRRRGDASRPVQAPYGSSRGLKIAYETDQFLCLHGRVCQLRQDHRVHTADRRLRLRGLHRRQIGCGPTGQFRIIVKDNPGDQTSPVLKNIWLRLFPFDIPELNDYDILIHFDPNVRICDPSFVEQILRRHEEQAGVFDLMLSAHPWNICLYQEARDSQQIAKYKNTDLERQIASYRQEGFPTDAGLWWNGFIVYNRGGDKPRLRRFQEKYWHDMIAYNETPDAHPQGQVSLSYCLWKSDLNVVTIPQLYRSSTLEIRPHIGWRWLRSVRSLPMH